MLIDDPQVRETLERIVARLASVPAVRDDLRQEALVHLWLLEEQQPGQTKSWYVQGCKFYLQNYQVRGRSVDSQKRNAGRVALGPNEDENENFLAKYHMDDGFFENLNATDIMNLLSNRLSDLDRQILDYLAEGLGACDIARRVGITHPAVIQHRKRIARLAMELGIPPVLQYRRKALPVRREPARAASRADKMEWMAALSPSAA